MSDHPKWVRGGFWYSPKFPLQDKKSAARFFLGKYLQKLGGDFASPHFAMLGVAHG